VTAFADDAEPHERQDDYFHMILPSYQKKERLSIDLPSRYFVEMVYRVAC
jgi:hypothetical protein